MRYEKVNMEDMIVVAALSAALFVSILCSMLELSITISSGLLGYIGGSRDAAGRHMKGEKENESIH